MKTQEKASRLGLVLGATIRLLITAALFIVIFAVGIYFLNISLSYAPVFATVAVGLGGFWAAKYIAKKREKGGAVTGFLTGLIIFAVITLIALFLNKSAVTINTLFHFVIIVMSSVVGGILGVNKKKTKELI